MKIFAIVVGTIEILIALFAAYLAVSMTIGFFSDDRFAGEWGLLLIPVDITVAVAFGWAGYVLVRRDSGVWKHQLVPLLAVAFIAGFAIWLDSA